MNKSVVSKTPEQREGRPAAPADKYAAAAAYLRKFSALHTAAAVSRSHLILLFTRFRSRAFFRAINTPARSVRTYCPFSYKLR